MYLRLVIDFLIDKNLVNQIISEFSAACSNYLDTVEIPESNEVLHVQNNKSCRKNSINSNR